VALIEVIKFINEIMLRTVDGELIFIRGEDRERNDQLD